MDQVSWRAVRAALHIARAARLRVGELISDFSFDEGTLRDHRWVRWDHYCSLIERIEALAGGPGRLESVILDNHYKVLENLAPFAWAFSGPTSLYRALLSLFMPANFPNQQVSVEVAGERIRVAVNLMSTARGCATFYSGINAAMRGLAQVLGRPPAIAEHAVHTDRSSEIVLVVPEAASHPTLSTGAAISAATDLVDEMAGELSLHIRALATTHDVLKKQTERVLLLNRLAKEIGSHIDVDSLVASVVSILHEHTTCDYVALWSGGPDQQVLICASGARPHDDETRHFPLVVGGRSIGSLEVAAPSGLLDVSFVCDLAPWIAIALDNAETFGRVARSHVSPAQLEQRLQLVTTRWTVTPRQLDVLRLVAQGLSNKEIASNLNCSENTVEVHVTQLLRRSGSSSRGHLIARFWSS